MKAEQKKEQVYTLSQLDSDMRRMLSVQIKELIHHIEDHEGIASFEPVNTARNVTWISMYDRYKIA